MKSSGGEVSQKNEVRNSRVAKSDVIIKPTLKAHSVI